MKYCLILIITSIPTAFLSSQTSTWEKTSFPDGNHVNFIKIIDQKIFVGSFEGLFLSEDAGTSWQNLTQNYPIVSVNDILATDDQYYLSAWSGGVWYSNNLITWESLSEGLPGYTTSLEVYDGNIYASSSYGVYQLNPDNGKWEQENLRIEIPHNKYIFDLYAGADSATLYASGCDYLYKKNGEIWLVVDTSYNYCGVKILESSTGICVNTTGSGTQKFNLDGVGISETIVPVPQDSSSWSPSDFAIYEEEMFITTKNLLYYHSLDSVETVCEDLLSAISLGLNNMYVGTQRLGVWRKAIPFYRPESDSRKDNNQHTDNHISLALSPSPSPEFVTAKIQTDGMYPAWFTVYDATGRIILTQEFSSTTDYIFSLNAPGIYLAVLSNGLDKRAKRIVIQ
jgi:hypothetical protein